MAKAQEKKPQRLRYTDAELSLMKNTFCDNPDILLAIRKFFLEMPLDPIDGTYIENIKNKKELVKLLGKTFLPQLDPNAPPHQLIDLWMIVEMKDKTVDVSYPLILARNVFIKYLENKLATLDGAKSVYEFAKFVEIDGKTPLELFVNLTVRNTLIAHVEMQLAQFALLSGESDETVEQTKERLFKNSSK